MDNNRRSRTYLLIALTSLLFCLLYFQSELSHFDFVTEYAKMKSVLIRAQTTFVEPKWPDLMLFVPVFPGGESELNKILLRSLKFFWPKKYLKLTVLVDEDLPPEIRDPFVERIKKSMENEAEVVHVKLNSIPREFYQGRGHDRQQLIMLWGDNFTDSEYVGFVDDDTLITNYVLFEDIFDEKGRPHVLGRSTNFTITGPGWYQVSVTTRWSDKSSLEVMRTMNYFPVVVKTAHLKDIRLNILKHHPEFTNFDDFFRRGIIRARRGYSQFNIMHQHLWKLKFSEYNWHVEATSKTDKHFQQIKEVTPEMTFPKRRCSLHYNSDGRSVIPDFDFVKDVFKRGFCYSLTKLEFDSDGENSRLCKKAGYSWEVVSTTPSTDHWLFEALDWRWDNRTVDAHINRMALNRPRTDWNQEEIKQIFS
ncbi:uncharacterized protein LOC142355139 [Convolutriloba macropyga]|uniref:uncharacterized protein LOC142355139 n=1 Tax=Convolutriloba macropyga TaxID=536237 RepID=UPI003F51D349